MDDRKYSLRLILPEDYPKLPGLLESVWGMKSDESYWRWKYIEPPFETVGYVTQGEDGEVVALTGFLGA